MALKMDVPRRGDSPAKGAYIKIVGVEASAKVGHDPFVMVRFKVFASKVERDKDKDAIEMVCPEVDQIKFPYDAAVMTGDPIANGYKLTKAHADFTGAEDV